MSRTLGQLLYALRKGELLLPNFQRPFVWEPERWQALLASILLEYPIGTALIGTEANSHTMAIRKPLSIPEDKLRDIFLKRMDELKPENLTKTSIIEYPSKGQPYSCEFLLDGQQRITSLDLILGTAYHFASGSELSPKNRLRWFLNLNKLGLDKLVYPNLREMQHEEACEAIVFVKYKKTDKNSPYYNKDSDSDLTDFCTATSLQLQAGLESGIYLPLDKLYSEDEKQNTLQYDSVFLNTFFFERQEIILSQTIDGKKLDSERETLGEEKYQESRKNLTKKFNPWKSSLEKTLNKIIEFNCRVEEVPSKEFGRLAGIFSVINISGVALDTFDLLVAKTTNADSNLREIMKSFCLQSFQEFAKSVELLPEPAQETAKNDLSTFWSISDFLGEKNTKEVDKGEEFPESIAKSFAQVIALQVKLSKALGDDWTTRNHHLSHCRENQKEPKLIEAKTPQEAARSILRLDNWEFSDKTILSLSKSEVQKVQEQAAKQLLRAYFFMKAKLGIPKLSSLPYRQMDLVLATVLTDSLWKQLNEDPTGTLMRKLQWWYWGSIFGGAYQKSQDKRVLADIPRLLAYLSKPTIKWEEVSNLSLDKETQYTWEGVDLESSRFTEIPIAGSQGTSGNRFERICDADGYSTKDALMSSANNAIGLTIRSFIIRNSAPDFKTKKNKNREVKRGDKIHAGRNDLQADHLFARNSWNKYTGQDVTRNDYAHPINSPLNYSWISAEANRYWSDNPSFIKLELASALNGDQESIDFLHNHLLSVEAVEHEYKHLLLGSEEQQKEKAEEVLKALLTKRFEKLRQALLNENPEK